MFALHQWKVLGFSVVEDAVWDIAVSKLGLMKHSHATRIVTLLEKTSPQYQNVAHRWFEILSGHVAGFLRLARVGTLMVIQASVHLNCRCDKRCSYVIRTMKIDCQ